MGRTHQRILEPLCDRQTMMGGCPICHYSAPARQILARDIAFGREDEEFHYSLCHACGHAWLHSEEPTSGVRFQEPSTGFVSWVMNHPVVRETIYRPRVWWLTRRLRLDADTSVLDVGCGTGQLLEILYGTYGCRCYGVEIDPALTRTIRPEIQIAVADFATFDTDERFNLITMFHLLEHLEDPQAAVITASKLLKPGGHLCIETPATDSLAFVLFGRYWFPLLPPYHRHIFSRRSLQQVLINSLPNSTLREQANVYMAGEVAGSACLPLLPYAPHPFRETRPSWWKACLSVLGMSMLLVLTLPLEMLIAGTAPILDIASHQRVLCRKEE